MVGIKFIILKAACQCHCFLEIKAKFTLVDDFFVWENTLIDLYYLKARPGLVLGEWGTVIEVMIDEWKQNCST